MYMTALTAAKTTLELSCCRYFFLPAERAAPTSHSSRETVAAWLQGHHITTTTLLFQPPAYLFAVQA